MFTLAEIRPSEHWNKRPSRSSPVRDPGVDTMTRLLDTGDFECILQRLDDD